MRNQNVIQYQRQRVFFSPSGLGGNLPRKPSDDEIRLMLASNNQQRAINRLVVSKANENPMHILRLALFSAFSKHNHSLRGHNFGIYSGPGQGKTTVVKCFAEDAAIPFIFIQSSSLKSTWQLFQAIRAEFEKQGFPLVPQTNEYHFLVPPCIVFFDEAHDLSLKLRRGGLLNPMEKADGWMMTSEDGKKNAPMHQIDCENICWVAASTDPGIIFEQSEAFYDRFTNHLIWHPAGKEEIARIVRQKHPQMPESACKTVAFYRRNPRMADAFAEQVVVEKRMMNCTWDEAAARIASVNQIDQWGMGAKELMVLKALGQRPIAKDRLIVPAQCRKQELEKMILPLLENELDGRPPLVSVTHKGYAITRAGQAELNRRGIAHRGDAILAESIV